MCSSNEGKNGTRHNFNEYRENAGRDETKHRRNEYRENAGKDETKHHWNECRENEGKDEMGSCLIPLRVQGVQVRVVFPVLSHW